MPFIQIDFLLKGNTAHCTLHTAHCTHQDAGPRRDNAMHSSAAVYILQNLPELKPTHSSLPPPTTYSFCHPTQALPPLGLLLLPTHPTLALTGSDLATLGTLEVARQQTQASLIWRITHRCPMPPPSCKLANCLKLCEPPKTVQRRGVCANRLKSEAARSSITFHMREPAPLSL